jgi:GNAT superfamily N-acetyltransferase
VTVAIRVLRSDEAAELAPKLLSLLVEFTPSASALTAEVVADRVRSPTTRVIVAEREDELLGTATLCVYVTLTTGVVGQVEDVIVTHRARGQRVGVRLMQELHRQASDLGCAYLQLTSRPNREIANHLYPSLGYDKRDTNVYPLRLPVTAPT